MSRAIIVGGGIAGPVAARFLQRAGWTVELYEAGHGSRDGYFLNLATNGLAVLDQLGLRDRLLGDAHPSPYLDMYSSTGALLGTVPNGPAGDPDRGSVIVRRDWLHEVVRVPSHEGHRLKGIEQTAEGVRATFANGVVAEGDILIGADGVNSVVRDHVDPTKPRYSGLIGLGGYARVPGLDPTPGRQAMVFGRRSFFGHLVRDDGTVYWFANVTAPAADVSLSSDEWLARLADLHRDDPSRVPQIIAGNLDPVRGYRIDDLVGVKRWHHGRVVAIGDAVHATSPSAGQGASLAVEDAMVLARELRDKPFEAAFAAYQAERQPRAELIVRYARKINSQKRVSRSRLAIAIRDAMLPRFLANASNDTSNNWLYNHEIEW